MTRTVTHELISNGAPHGDDGRLMVDRCVGGSVSTGGPGRARCTCGDLSPVLRSGPPRRAWYRDHLAYAATEAGQRADLAGIICEDVALPLLAIVRDEDSVAVDAHLADLDRRELVALAVVLAGMVPGDRSADDLLAWTRWAEREAVAA